VENDGKTVREIPKNFRLLNFSMQPRKQPNLDFDGKLPKPGNALEGVVLL
jgi:hypothetical protein